MWCVNMVTVYCNMLLCPEEYMRNFLTFIVYMTILLDNVLLTVIVPILPDYLAQIDDESIPKELHDLKDDVRYKSLYLHYMKDMFGSPDAKYTPEQNLTSRNESSFEFDIVKNKLWSNSRLNEENSSVGILLAVKALVQLVATPFVTKLISQFGYCIPTIFGTFCLFLASFVFAIGNSYFLLFLARGMQGIASACIGVCGMSLIAQLYPEEKVRSRVLGIVLGSMALGVLLGYPFGGIMYAFLGKSAPFSILALVILLVFVLQLAFMDLKAHQTEVNVKSTDYKTLLSDAMVLQIVGAIFISTTAMAILEPCLPIWLMANLSPQKWQVGTVFIPDSIGYFISTNFFATIALKYGQIKTSILALLLVGVSCLLIPHANSVISLVLPHFTLGIGIGTLDAALVPLLASIVDLNYGLDGDVEQSPAPVDSCYGPIYAIQQMAVSLAYSVGPMVGGEVAQYVGFEWLMSIIGLMNIIYGLFLYSFVMGLFYLKSRDNSIILNVWPATIDSSSDYKRFYNPIP